MSAPAYLAGLSCSRLLHYLHYLHSLHFQYYFAKVGIEGMINLLWIGVLLNSDPHGPLCTAFSNRDEEDERDRGNQCTSAVVHPHTWVG